MRFMASRKSQRPKRPRKASVRLHATPRRRSRAAGSRVGDDLLEAFEQMAAHLRGEIELEDVSQRR
jgi:hypothetical protein